MAQVAGFVGGEPYILTAPDLVAGIPTGALVDAYTVTMPSTERTDSSAGPGLFRTGRFFFPPAIFTYATDFSDLELAGTPIWQQASVKDFLPGALYPEAVYLEPTLGQIWPR